MVNLMNTNINDLVVAIQHTHEHFHQESYWGSHEAVFFYHLLAVGAAFASYLYVIHKNKKLKDKEGE